MTTAAAHARPWDLVLFGATGFVGQMIAAHLAEHAPPQLRWAIAGRSAAKLAALHAELPRTAEVAAIGVIEADVDDPASLAAMAAQTKVVLTTVGPYVRWGEPVAAACVDAGAHYLDLTGEPIYVANLIERLHDRAREAGVALVPCCGYDSIPVDLGVYYTVGQLPQGVPLRLRGYMQGNGAPSGGTLASAIAIFAGEQRRGIAATIAPRTSADGRSVQPIKAKLHRNRAVRLWGLPMPTVDPSIALRSAGMLERYGPDFAYGHFVGMRRLPTVAATVVGGGIFFGAARLKPVQRLLTRMRPPGTGPSKERRDKSWFRLRIVGEGGGIRVITEMSGGDPGYDETTKMVAEAAILMATDGAAEGGVLTPAVAFGDRLLERLDAVGLGLRRVD
ncbi:MAG: saccharopine dehydrogenase NADP-binding domain-containing protein [Nannocystaceae bacterium]